jgi:hypothetical protein
MTFHASLLYALAILATGSLADAQTTNAPAQGADAQAAAKYVRASDSGGKLRNLASPVGEVVLDAKPGTLLAVRAERNGWLEVEPASGMKVWIYGTYLKKSNTPGVAEINANSVRMRPLPSSDQKSFPLPMKLDRGERVRVLSRADASKPLAEDWVQVWSPAGATAWVLATETKPLAAGEDGRTAWAGELKAAQAALPVVDVFGTGDAGAAGTGAAGAAAAGAAGATEASSKSASAKDASAKTESKSHAANEKLTEGEKLLKAAQASDNPDYTAAKAAFAAVIAVSAEGAAADTAHQRLEEISIREEIQRLKADKDKLQSERAQKLAEAEAKLKAVAQRQDPLWGRFQARGWLEKQVQPGMPNRYAVTWGGKEVAESPAGTGAELDRFVSCEIGVLGVAACRRARAAEAPGTLARVDALDQCSAWGGS